MTETQTTRIDGENHRRPYLLFAMIAAVLILLAAGNLIQLLLINPTAQHNEHEISHLSQHQEEFTCALAKQTADGYRNRGVAPHGGIEPVPHFRRRLFDQRRTLIAALPLHCVGVGKDFRKRVLSALGEIDRLIARTQLVDEPAAPTAHSPPGSDAIAAATTSPYKFEPPLGLPSPGPSPPHHSPASGHPSHHPAPSPSPPKHQGGHGGSGGHSAPPEEASPPPSSPEASPPSQSQPSESAPPATPPPTEPPPKEPTLPPTTPITPIEKSTGVNVCIENPLLPLCVGVKGTSVTVE